MSARTNAIYCISQALAVARTATAIDPPWPIDPLGSDRFLADAVPSGAIPFADARRQRTDQVALGGA
jgi:hypothetical protein